MFLPLNSFENICVCFLLMIIYTSTVPPDGSAR